jgi:hypothetical protein
MSKAVWNPYYTRVFCDICMEEVNDNNREGGCLSRKGYKNLGDKFAEKTGDRRTQKQFKNKWDAMKKDYTGWMELQNATGLGWDPIAKTMDADDDWWKNHLAIRPDHAKFRNGPPANLEQQDVMFRKAHVTGESAAIQEGMVTHHRIFWRYVTSILDSPLLLLDGLVRHMIHAFYNAPLRSIQYSFRPLLVIHIILLILVIQIEKGS